MPRSSPRRCRPAAQRPRPATATRRKRLAIGIAATRDFLPHEIGRAPQIEATAGAVKAAMRDAGITRVDDVHWVQVKCPLLTAERVQAARRAGHEPVTEIAYKSMAYSRGASALGVGVAHGRNRGAGRRRSRAADWSLVLRRRLGLGRDRIAEQHRHRARQCRGGDRGLRHLACGDAGCDRRLRGDRGDAHRGCPTADEAAVDASRIVNVLAKADPSPDGMLRGWRHTMLDDTDISATRHARAAVGGVIAGLTGCPAVFVSGGAEHQGPPGGGPVAVILRI